jgi:hypothetical protein
MHHFKHWDYFFYNNTMARFFDPNYDPRQDSGSSGSEITDLHPERNYDTDLRRIAESERPDIEAINNDQGRIRRFFKAAKTANKYRQEAYIDEPTIRGETPRSPAIINGAEVPSTGDEYGTVGSVGYAKKPQPQSGTFYGFGAFG